jgi:hypothetical protein
MATIRRSARTATTVTTMATSKRAPSALPLRTTAQSERLAEITDDDVTHARGELRRMNPRLAALCDARALDENDDA